MKHDMSGFAAMDPRLRQIADHLMTLSDSISFNPASVGAKLLPNLFVLDIERDADATRLRIRLIGTALDQIFRHPLQGHCLEDYIHGPRGSDIIAAFHDCARTREPLWMRQVVRMPGKAPRFAEGVAIYLAPERIYGGLVMGDFVGPAMAKSFERASLLRGLTPA